MTDETKARVSISSSLELRVYRQFERFKEEQGYSQNSKAIEHLILYALRQKAQEKKATNFTMDAFASSLNTWVVLPILSRLNDMEKRIISEISKHE
jgi:metal-responsive CopG/Arc/MetJ family transcriptional regulator